MYTLDTHTFPHIYTLITLSHTRKHTGICDGTIRHGVQSDLAWKKSWWNVLCAEVQNRTLFTLSVLVLVLCVDVVSGHQTKANSLHVNTYLAINLLLIDWIDFTMFHASQ